MALTVSPALQAKMVFPEIIHQFHWTSKENAAGAHLVRPAHPARSVHLEQPESKDTWEYLANQAKLDHKAHPAHLDPLARKARTAFPVPRANPAKMPKKARKDHLDHKEKPENLVQLERKERRDPLANLAPRPTTDHLDHLVKAANPERKDHPDPKVHRASLVQTPTIARARNVLPKLQPRQPPRPKPKRKSRNRHQSNFVFPSQHDKQSLQRFFGHFPKPGDSVFTIHIYWKYFPHAFLFAYEFVRVRCILLS